MLLKLGEENKWTGGKIGLTMIREMVTAYQKPNTAKINFNYAHFTVKEILDLLIANKIIPEGDYTNPTVNKYGFKIYMGNHHELDNCPALLDIKGQIRRNTQGEIMRNSAYIGYNTPILCNTIIVNEKNHLYQDMLMDDNVVSIVAQGGYGIDQTVLCPPDCSENMCSEEDATDDNVCEYDIAKKPKLP